MTDKDLQQPQGRSREQIRAERKANKKDRKQEREYVPTKTVRVRLLPIWLRLILIVILLAGSLIFGLMIGYGVIGDGHPADVLHKDTWQHVIDIVKQKE